MIGLKMIGLEMIGLEVIGLEMIGLEMIVNHKICTIMLKNLKTNYAKCSTKSKQTLNLLQV